MTVIAAGALVAVAPAEAAAPSRTPSAFYGVTVPNLKTGDEFAWHCMEGDWSGEPTGFQFMSLEYPQGGVEFGGSVTVKGAASFPARVKAGPVDHTIEPDLGGGRIRSDRTWSSYEGKIGSSGVTLRAGFALWGDDASACLLTINSDVIPLHLQPSDRATYLRPADFGDNVAVESTFVSANTQGTYSRNTDGWLFALFYPSFGSSVGGGGSVDGPDGEHMGGWSQIHQRTKGTWRYTLGAGAGEWALPLLWIIELPN